MLCPNIYARLMLRPIIKVMLSQRQDKGVRRLHLIPTTAQRNLAGCSILRRLQWTRLALSVLQHAFD